MTLFLIVLVAGALLLNRLFRDRALDGIDYRLDLGAHTAEVGEPLTVTTVLENKKRLPVPFLKLYERLPENLSFCSKEGQDAGEWRTMTMYILPWQRVRRSYQIMAQRRGRYLFRGARITAGDLLGLSEVTTDAERMEELIAYPKAIDPGEALYPLGSLCGDYPVKRLLFEDPILTAGFREYTGHEPIKTIHWPVSAKTGRLMVKQFEYTSDRTVQILLSIDCQAQGLALVDVDAVEWCFSICRGVMEGLEEAGVPYGVRSNADSFCSLRNDFGVAPGLGRAHFESVLELMGRSACFRSSSFEELLASEEELASAENRSLVIIAPGVAPKERGRIARLWGRFERVYLIAYEQDGATLEGIPGVVVLGRRDGGDA